MTEQQHIIIDKNASVVTIRLNRPAKKNAFTQQMYSEATAALKAADEDETIKVVVFEGSGDSFSAGNDLNAFLSIESLDETAPPFKFLHLLNKVKVTLVAKVNGLAIGIGTTLLLHCDLVYAADNAVFALPFVQLGLLPEAGSSLLLPRIMGHQRASELLLLGDSFSANKAQQYGLVNDVVEADKLNTRVDEVVEHLVKQSRGALRTSKKLIKTESDTVSERISLEAGYFAKALSSDTAKQAIAAKLKKN